MNFNKEKWIALVLFIIFVIILIFVSVYKNDFFTKNSDLLSILSTLTFIYLTYETLRQTRQSETLPHVSVRFILASKVDENFTRNNKGLVLNQQVKRLLDDFKKDDPVKKDLVFIKVENVGETTAIEVRVDLDYSTQAYGKDHKQNISIPFGVLKKDETVIELVDSFEVPTKNDFFKIEKCITVFNTVSRKNAADGLKRNDVSKTLSFENSDEDVSIIFKK